MHKNWCCSSDWTIINPFYWTPESEWSLRFAQVLDWILALRAKVLPMTTGLGIGYFASLRFQTQHWQLGWELGTLLRSGFGLYIDNWVGNWVLCFAQVSDSTLTTGLGIGYFASTLTTGLGIGYFASLRFQTWHWQLGWELSTLPHSGFRLDIRNWVSSMILWMLSWEIITWWASLGSRLKRPKIVTVNLEY